MLTGKRGTLIAAAIVVVVIVLMVFFLVLPKMAQVERQPGRTGRRASATGDAWSPSWWRCGQAEANAPKPRRSIREVDTLIPPTADPSGVPPADQERGDRVRRHADDAHAGRAGARPRHGPVDHLALARQRPVPTSRSRSSCTRSRRCPAPRRCRASRWRPKGSRTRREPARPWTRGSFACRSDVVLFTTDASAGPGSDPAATTADPGTSPAGTAPDTGGVT